MFLFKIRERERIRTFDRLLRRQMLYPAELRTLHFVMSNKQKLPRGSLFVGVAGFEPATSWSQTRRDDRATLHPEYFTSCGGYEIRTHATRKSTV